MRTLQIDIADIGGEATPGDTVVIYAPTLRSGETPGRVVSSAPRVIQLTNGRASTQVEAGPIVVRLRCRNIADQRPIKTVVPEGTGNITLADILRGHYSYTPEIAHGVGADADAAKKAAEKAVQAAREVMAAATEVQKNRGQVGTELATIKTYRDESLANKNAAEQAKRDVDAVNQHMGEVQRQLVERETFLHTINEPYNWLRQNFTGLAEKINQLTRDAAAGIKTELQGLATRAEQAKTSAEQAAQRATAASNVAGAAAASAVSDAIAQLKSGAAPYDTLGKIADRIKPGGTLETTLLGKLGEKAQATDVSSLTTRLNNLGIAGVAGLQQALNGKLNTTEVTTDATPSKLVRRTQGGHVPLPEIINTSPARYAATKEYVDNQTVKKWHIFLSAPTTVTNGGNERPALTRLSGSLNTNTRNEILLGGSVYRITVASQRSEANLSNTGLVKVQVFAYESWLAASDATGGYLNSASVIVNTVGYPNNTKYARVSIDSRAAGTRLLVLVEELL